jgi:hypothetical protein
MTMEAIKEAIAALPAEQKTSLATWLIQQDMDLWNKQIEEDFSPGGPGMALLEEAETDLQTERVQTMDEFLAEVKAVRDARTKPRS